MRNVYDVLKERGLIAQVTHEEEIRELLGKEKVTFYFNTISGKFITGIDSTIVNTGFILQGEFDYIIIEGSQYTNLQLEEGTVSTSYEPYKEYKNEFKRRIEQNIVPRKRNYCWLKSMRKIRNQCILDNGTQRRQPQQNLCCRKLLYHQRKVFFLF